MFWLYPSKGGSVVGWVTASMGALHVSPMLPLPANRMTRFPCVSASHATYTPVGLIRSRLTMGDGLQLAHVTPEATRMSDAIVQLSFATWTTRISPGLFPPLSQTYA